jgi:hypothetical protein
VRAEKASIVYELTQLRPVREIIYVSGKIK